VVLGRGALLLSIGAAIGIASALAASRLFSPILYGVSSTDPATYSLALALMTLVAFAACWFPARRAIKVDPVRSLRTE
jgi:ABC-type antimicrobial peptide transport system permease subunit